MLTAGITSCDDYLTVLPTDQITEEDFWNDKNDLDNVRAAAYAKMISGGITDRMFLWGEVRSDNMKLNNLSRTDIMYFKEGVLQPTEGMFDWAEFYTGINYCNKVLEYGEKMVADGRDPSFSMSDWNPLKAEVLALRSLYYFHLVRAYRDVPFVVESISTDAEAKRAIHLKQRVCMFLIHFSLIWKQLLRSLLKTSVLLQTTRDALVSVVFTRLWQTCICGVVACFVLQMRRAIVLQTQVIKSHTA